MGLLTKLLRSLTFGSGGTIVSSGNNAMPSPSQAVTFKMLTDMGLTIDGNEAPLTHDAIWRAVNLIASQVGNLPLEVYRREGEGKVKAKEHPAYNLLRHNPDKTTHAHSFFEVLAGHVLLKGNGYAYIERDPGFKPTSLTILNPDDVTPFKVDGRLYYAFAPNGQQTAILEPSQIFHVKGLGYNGYVGYSVMEYATNTFTRAIVTNKYAKKYFENSAIPPFVIAIPPETPDETRDAIMESWKGRYGGVANAHSPAIVTQGYELKPLSVNAKDSQLLESRAFSRVEIANWFSIPPHKVGDAARTSYNSLEQENKAFLNECLNRWLLEFESEARLKLLSDEEREADSHVVEFNRDALLRADTKTRFEVYQIGRNIGVLSANDIRAKENESPIENGNTYLQPLNMGVASDEANVEEEEAPQAEVAPQAETMSRLNKLLPLAIARLVKRCDHERAKKSQDWTSIISVFEDEFALLLGDTHIARSKLLTFTTDFSALSPDDTNIPADDLISYFKES